MSGPRKLNFLEKLFSGQKDIQKDSKRFKDIEKDSIIFTKIQKDSKQSRLLQRRHTVQVDSISLSSRSTTASDQQLMAAAIADPAKQLTIKQLTAKQLTTNSAANSAANSRAGNKTSKNDAVNFAATRGELSPRYSYSAFDFRDLYSDSNNNGNSSEDIRNSLTSVDGARLCGPSRGRAEGRRPISKVLEGAERHKKKNGKNNRLRKLSQPGNRLDFPTTPELILEAHKSKKLLDDNEEWLLVELDEFECLVDSLEVVRLIAKHSKFFEVEPGELWHEFFSFVDNIPFYDEVINFDVWQEFRDKKYSR